MTSTKKTENVQAPEFETRYKFYFLYEDVSEENFQNILVEKEISCLNFYANPKDEKSLQNSWEITDTFEEIVKRFRNYMKQLTSDFLELHQDNFQTTNPSLSSKYIFRLFDVETDSVVYETKISASDYIYNPNFPLSIIFLWKDNGVNKGIRSILKDTVQKIKFTNRFTNHRHSPNISNANAYDVYTQMSWKTQY